MSAIDTAGNVSLSGQRHDVDKSLKEKKWEEVQIKAFTSWLNSILSSRGLEVKNLTEDLKDGLHLVNLCEVTSGKLLKGIDKRPHIPIQKINNINIALNFLRNDLNVRLDLIGAEDVFSGNLKMILGMIFAIFRKVVHGKIGQLTGSSESESQEVGLLRWIREQTDGYDGVKIVDFRSSFNDGLAFNALVHRFDANLFDYDAIDKADKAENLKRAFALAEKHLGVPQLLDVNDLLSGDADERSIILYSSLYFHAFVSNEERRKAMGVQEGLTHQIEDTKTKLSTTERQLQEALSRAQGLTEDNSDLLARIAKLEEQLGFYQKARQTDAETMDLLSEKVSVLGTLLADEKNTRSATEQARFQLQQEIEELNRRLTQTEQLSEHEIEELRKRLEMLRDKEETERKELELARKKLAETSEDFERALEEAEARKRELGEQIAGLRRSVAEEKEIRRQREAEVQQLRQECQKLKKSAVSQGRARHGLGLLKRNLEEHLEDMYKWRQLHHGSVEGSRFDLAAVVSETANKTFEQTLTYLDEKLQEENKSLLRIVQLQDNAVQDRIEKEGVLRMKFRKDWSKRYFRLTGNKISWYPEDGNGRREGTVDLTKQCEIVRQKAIKSEEAGISKFWPLKLTVVLQVKQLVDGVETLVDQEKKLFIRAASKKERHAWFSLIAGKIASINYRQALEHESNPRPDTRILTFLQASDDTEFFLDGRPVSHQGIIAISKVLAGHDQLKTLSISEAALSAESVAVFSEGVLKSQAIDSISLSKNNISDEAGAALVQRLATLNRITSLNLSHNQLGAATASSLAGSIANFPGLHDLNLSHNQLGSDGVGNLTTALQQNRTPLTALHLAHNNIGPAAAGPIAGLLAASETITSVDLSGNDLGNEGLAALVEGLRSNRSVRSLDLSHTKISSAGLHHLKSLLEANRLLDQVILTHNDLSASDLASFSVAGFVFHDLSLSRHA